MESFSFLKYWRGGGGGAHAAAAAKVRTTSAVASSILRPNTDADDDEDAGEHDDDGPFFDLEFSVHEDDAGGHEKDVSDEEEEDDDEREFNFLVSSNEGLRSDPVSPSDDLFFKGKLVSLESSSIVVAAGQDVSLPKHHNNFPVSFLKSATKLRVLMLGLRKHKTASAVEVTEPHGGDASPKPHGSSKLFIKFKVEEVPIVSLFTRDHSSKISAKAPAKSPPEVSPEEKRFAKEVVHKYLNKIKPLYVKVSKRYSEKLRFSGNLNPAAMVVDKEGDDTDAEADPTADAATPPVVACGVRPPRASVPAGLKVVCKRLGKSRSASAAAVAVPSQPPPPPQRRDDSLLQHEDGIQSAILHCKRSFNSSKGSESPLVRSMSDPGDGRSEKS
ncbi:probable membrane-associated kinase regulator 2 [Typha angustifolia]|uniref:probable membrane-associated kinase regulator 2 n=1 Tax=Typha angustifolia TaxID=59011 RepID=UPI003C2F96C1